MIELYLKDIPMAIPLRDIPREPNFTCRVWFREAIRQLNWSQMFVHCNDVDALEKEVWESASGAECWPDLLPRLTSTRFAGPWS